MPTSPIPGRMGRYELLAEIESDPAGVTYLGHDPDRGSVAVRVFRLPDGASTTDRTALEESLLSRARQASRLHHPGLAAVHDCGRDPRTGDVFVVFERGESPTVADRLDAGPPFTWSESLSVVRDIAQALQHMHESGIVHGDVRAVNVQLGPDGRPKLVNFGMFRVQAPDATVVGMSNSPDTTARSGAEPVNREGDIAGAGDLADRLLRGREGHPASTGSVEGGLPPGVDEVIARARGNASGRYPEARLFAADLDDLLNGRAPQGPFAVAVETTRRFAPVGPAAHDAEPLVLETAHGRARRGGRAIAGVAALALVLVLEARRSGDSTAPVPPPTTVVASATSPSAGAAPVADPDLPSLNEPAAAETATLQIDVEHPLRNGRLNVFVDGSRLAEERLVATGGKSVLGLKMRSQRLVRSLDVLPGRRQVRVEILWNEDSRSQTIAINLKPGTTRRLVVRLGRLSKNLSVELR